MEKQANDFTGLISMIKKATTEEDFKLIAVRQYADKFVYGQMMGDL